jgi:DNA (cytosine-5)-methyltransferase 1
VTRKDRWTVVDGDRRRLLTTAESRRAMDFPEGYILPPAHRRALPMLGNATCPGVVMGVCEEFVALAG